MSRRRLQVLLNDGIDIRRGHGLRGLWRVWVLMVLGCVGVVRGAAQGVEVYQLENGLQLAYVQDSTRRLLHVGLTIRGGASVNPEGKAGLTHFFEHHFFGEVDTLGGGKGFQGLGMLNTGATYNEHQTFTVSMAPAQMEVGMRLLEGALVSALEREPRREKILEEIAGELQAGEENPSVYLMEGIRTRLWEEAYWAAKDVGGQYGELMRVSGEVLRAVLKAYVHPRNCLLSATGPGDAVGFFQCADSLLGGWQPEASGTYIPHLPFAELGESEYFVLENEYATRPLLVMAWPVPGIRGSTDTARLAQAFAELGRLKNGVFHKALTGTGLAEALWWEYEPGLNPGYMVLRVVPAADKISACLAAVEGALKEMSASDKSMARADLVQTAERLAALEAGLAWDRSASRLDWLGRRWAALDPGWALMGVPGMPDGKALRAFALRYVVGRPHVAGLLVNSELAMVAEGVFKPGAGRPVAGVEPVVKVDSVPVVVADTVPELDVYDMAMMELAPIRIYFMENSVLPDSVSMVVLKRVAVVLRQVPDLKVYVNGYADGLGDGVVNYQLSIQRAQSVQGILSGQGGVDEKRLILRPFGEAFPEYPDDTPVNRSKNRRVTFERAPADAEPRYFY